jgi:phage tail-like protein
MRGALEDLPTPHPLGQTLPSIYRTDSFTQQLCRSFDEVLAPVISALDNLPAYLDLGTAPEDLLPWLAHWLGLAVDRGDDPVRQRDLLHSTSELHGWQGTRRGIELAISAQLGVRAEVVESGGATWSVDPRDPLPGEPLPAVVVQVFPVAGQEIDPDRLRAAVEALKPAHVIHRVQVVPAD